MSNYNKITALYSRLSVGDEDRDGGESNSIQNQKIFLENYAKGQHLTNIRHYIDDDESGRFFDRSAYSRMIEDVESHTKAAKPDQIICLCGCMAQQKVVADKVKNSYHHVDLVLGPQAEWRLPELLHEVYTKNKRVFSIENEHGRIAEDLPIVREGGVRAWVSIMYGCNNFCSYCIVPYVRGR